MMPDGVLATRPDGLAIIDLRSDTVTKPTDAMYERMLRAPIGDDGLDGDPSAQELEGLTAELLGKEAGVFVPTCTMANLLALLVHTQRADQVLVEHRSHIYTTERGAGVFAKVSLKPVAGGDGAMDADLLTEVLSLDRGRVTTSLVCMETSHNGAGGAVLPLGHMNTIQEIARHNGLRVHLDGARIFNAAVALDVRPAEVARFSDTVAVCLSKGLSAPAGAVLVGAATTIMHARKLRKMLGGTQHQIGVLAAAGIEAIEKMRSRLVEDHVRAARLADAINSAKTRLRANTPQTNIVRIDISQTGRHGAQWVESLAKLGILTRSAGTGILRCVTHRHIDDAAIERSAKAFLSLA